MKRPMLVFAVTALLAGTTAFFLTARPAVALASGISSSKGCAPGTPPDSDVQIGAMMACQYIFGNTNALGSEGEGNTVVLNSIVDTVESSPNDVSGNLLTPLITANGVLTGWTLAGGATCNSIANDCTLPPGATITSPFIDFHTVTASDYQLDSTTHELDDSADFGWADTCNTVTTGCSKGGQNTSDGGSITVVQDASATVTAINGDPTLTKVFAGSSVTDQATVSPGTGAAATTTPTGTVTFTFFTSGDCSTGGTVLTPDSNLVSGVATSGSEGPLTAGSYSFQATYNGDGTYNSSTGACEPLTVIGSTTVTAIQPSSTVAAGTSVTDKATVTGSDGGTPTGTVTFTFYTSGDCSTGGTVLTPDSNLVAGVATSGSEGPLTAGSYSFQATYNGETGVYPSSTGTCEPLTVTATGNANFTPGFWKNHKNATTPLLPQTLGPYTVHTFAQAQGILSGMGCGSVGALNCMAGMLLAADLNLAQGGSTCIVTNGTIAMANTLLTTYNYNFTTNGLKPYTLSPTDQAKAMALHDALSAYNIDGVPTC